MEKIDKPKARCPGCGKDFISVNIYLAKASELNVAFGLQQDISLDLVGNNNQLEPNNIEHVQPQVPSDRNNVLQLNLETDTFADPFRSFS